NTPVSQINYDFIGLLKQKEYDKGLLIRTTWLEDGFEPIKVVEEEYTYEVINEIFFSRHTVIRYYDLNGDIASEYTKNFTKFFNPSEAYSIGEDRRKFLINKCKIIVFDIFSNSPDIAFSLLYELKNEIEFYINALKQPLIVALSDTNRFTFLDIPVLNKYIPGNEGSLNPILVRQFLISEFTYD
ncbi:MAG: hypothetical protein SFU98_15845, partial [Leptospiraceae bacterium]|nr:hypothetical protein [Leptospiraceae bacterium]